MLTVKDLHIAIKNGKGTSFLMQRYGFEDEESLFKTIRGIVPNGASGFIKDLKKNQHKLDRTNAKSIKKEEENKKSNVQAMEENFDEELIVQSSDNNSDEGITENETDIEISLEQLEAEEVELSMLLRKLEGEHKDVVAQRRICITRLEKAQRALQELQRILSEQQKNVEQIMEEYEQLASRMNDITEECSDWAELLENVREQIAERKKVVISVKESGIEVENAEYIYISADNISEQITQLISMPDAKVEELTIKELKIIAKLQLMVKAYEQSGLTKIELEFDSAKVQSFYETVAA